MKTYALTPTDAWFFRDGRPYNEKESNQADVASLFPPSARSLSGALRAALARTNGWNGHGPWTPGLNAAFGPGPDDLGALQFTGPFLISGTTALWPLPCHLLGRPGQRWQPVAFLQPDTKTSVTDSGDLNLPCLALPPGEKSDGLKPAESAWVTTAALSTILAGGKPAAAAIFAAKDLWAHEPRVGLRRDENTLTTGEGALYSPAYVRLRKGVSLGVGVDGVPADFKADIPPIFPFGGESRLTHCTPWLHDPIPVPPPVTAFETDKDGFTRFTVILLTPGAFKNPPLPAATIISACVGKTLFIGGWDSLRRQPLPLQPFAPAGSVWFCTAAAADFTAIHAQHGTHLGPNAAHGYGLMVIGRWPQPLA